MSDRKFLWSKIKNIKGKPCKIISPPLTKSQMIEWDDSFRHIIHAEVLKDNLNDIESQESSNE